MRVETLPTTLETKSSKQSFRYINKHIEELGRGRYRKENARIRDKPKFKIGEAEGISQFFKWDFGFWHKI